MSTTYSFKMRPPAPPPPPPPAPPEGPSALLLLSRQLHLHGIPFHPLPGTT